MVGSAQCPKPPAGWKCRRPPGHRGKCLVYPTWKAARVFVPGEALLRLQLASERAHLWRYHPGPWETCGYPTCVRDREYLGAQGIVTKTGTKLR
jgi:hypothetical protein